MRTDDLVLALSRSVSPVNPAAVSRRFAGALLACVLLSVLAMLAFLGPRPDWRVAIDQPMFWAKLGFPALVAMSAFVCVRRLGYPGMRLGWAPAGAVAALVMVWAMAAWVLVSMPASQRLGMVLGTSWWQCVVIITALSVPAFILAFRTMTTVAPTRLRLSGFMAGLFAGSTAAFAYAMYCPETQAPFLATWYVLGMLTPAAAGAALGRKLLRW